MFTVPFPYNLNVLKCPLKLHRTLDFNKSIFKKKIFFQCKLEKKCHSIHQHVLSLQFDGRLNKRA